MSNPISKLQSHTLPGDFFQSAVCDTYLALESRLSDRIIITVFELSSGKLLHEAPARVLSPWYSLCGFHGELLLLQLFENRQNPDQVKLFGYDWASDKLLPEVTEMPCTIPSIVPPTFYPATSEYFPLFKQLIGEEIVLGCEYMEISPHIVVSYYLNDQAYVSRHLLVLTDGEEVYREVQDKEMKGIALGSFFTFRNKLIFVRHKRELNIYAI